MSSSPQRIIDIALFAGKTMLENGAETYRVEETIQRLCEAQCLEEVNCFCVPTGIFLSVNFEGHDHTYVRRVKQSRIDLEIIAMVNDFSRQFTLGTFDVEDALTQLEKIACSPKFPTAITLGFSGVAGGFFTLLYGGGNYEFVATFLVCFFTAALLESHGFKRRSYFIKHVFGGISIAFITFCLVQVFDTLLIPLNSDYVIIGALMPLVPGVAFTNALRDTISGDFLSGMSKLSEALAIAVAIALGVGGTVHFLPL